MGPGYCPNCATPHDGTGEFCANCGQRLPDQPPTPAAATVAPTPTPTSLPPPPPLPPLPGAPPPPASASAGAPPAAATSRAGLGVLGAIGAAVGTFLPWLLLVDVSGFGVPFVFLFTGEPFDPADAGFSLGIAVLILAVLGGLAALGGGARFRRICGRIIGGLAILYAARLLGALNDLGSTDSFFEVLGPGPYVALVGGALMSVKRKQDPA